MSLKPLHLTPDPLDADALAAAVVAAAPAGAFGALVTFVGTVRGEHQGRRVVRLEYESYEPLALKALAQVADEAAGHWPEARLAVHHRLGVLALGEASVVIVAAAPHRAEAFQACRYAIERIKQIVPIWKHERFEDGEAWVEGATADPADQGARRDAYRRACG